MFELQVHQAHRRRVLLFERTQLMASDTDTIQEVIQEVMENEAERQDFENERQLDIADDWARDAANDAEPECSPEFDIPSFESFGKTQKQIDIEHEHELEQARMADEGCPNFEDDK